MLLFTLYLLLIKIISISSLSGLYTDNGFDQTALHHEMTPDDQNSMKHDILELLGLPNRPQEKNRKLSLRKSAPQFLIDIYNHLTGVRSRSKRSLLENEFEQRNVEESDVIMSFMNKKQHRSDLLFFDVSKISTDVFLMNSELRVYKSGGNQDFLLKIFFLNEKFKLRELSSVNVSSTHQGWIHLNVTEGLVKWMESSNGNRGLFIKAQSLVERSLESFGIVTSKVEDEEHQPFMVGFFKGQEKVSLKKHRRKRAAPKRTQLQVTNPFFPSIPVPAERACSIQTLFVNFKDLKWHDWIIAPEGFGAFYCSGECNFPLNSNMNATNHAIIQTLVHLLHPQHVPKPCCAPTNLGPVSVLYYLDDTNVNLKKYKNMVVESCGCH